MLQNTGAGYKSNILLILVQYTSYFTLDYIRHYIILYYTLLYYTIRNRLKLCKTKRLCNGIYALIGYAQSHSIQKLHTLIYTPLCAAWYSVI